MFIRGSLLLFVLLVLAACGGGGSEGESGGFGANETNLHQGAA